MEMDTGEKDMLPILYIISIAQGTGTRGTASPGHHFDM